MKSATCSIDFRSTDCLTGHPEASEPAAGPLAISIGTWRSIVRCGTQLQGVPCEVTTAYRDLHLDWLTIGPSKFGRLTHRQQPTHDSGTTFPRQLTGHRVPLMNSNHESQCSTTASTPAKWNIAEIVADLHRLREESLVKRLRSAKPVKLPAREALSRIVEQLSAALFPNRLGTPELAAESVDYFVGHTLDLALRELVNQVQRELRFVELSQPKATPSTDNELNEQACSIVQQFTKTLPAIREILDTDLQAAYEGDPAARSVDEVLVCYPGIAAIIHHRIAHQLYKLGVTLVARIIAEIAHSSTGIDIHPGATISRSFFIDHGTGVVIGETAIIGQRVRLYHGVTLGAKSFPVDENGALTKGNARHPIVEDDVIIYAGATILGRITIGRGSVIGGNVWLTRSCPPDSNISQAKLRSDDFVGGSGI